MQLEPLTKLHWAYQLHYYICFRTHRRKTLFSSKERGAALSRWLTQICGVHEYHLLRSKPYPNHLRCLTSLQPSHTISSVLQVIKSNLSRELGEEFALSPPVWARGYLAQSVGRVRIDAVRRYLDHQAEHHGYASRLQPPVYRYRASKPVPLRAAHASFDLNHHLVLATRYRRSIFTSKSGEALATYWLKVAAKRGFAIDQMTVVPDHLHLLVRIVPKMSIESCALSLMNNGQLGMANHFPEVLVKEKIDQLWQASAYAGTCGNATTALVEWFLTKRD